MDTQIQDALAALKTFMFEMNAWESDLYGKLYPLLMQGKDDPAINAAAEDPLRKILSAHAILDKANQGRLIDLGCGDPPSYDPEKDTVDSAVLNGKNVVVMLTQGAGSRSRYRITLSRVDGEWKIRKRELLNYRDKFQRSAL